ncbi:hypothetical protein SAMN05443550_104287 [Pedobacter hartonius]|uniref:Uncharacterized protein n=1 Tax=Pedobacter hartonius TaxID=425514 RepID=A0A1H4D2G7_9SPHI|nr:hypothetical protein SAMN05443550_104287 [Pedobacter hartonius]
MIIEESVKILFSYIFFEFLLQDYFAGSQKAIFY